MLRHQEELLQEADFKAVLSSGPGGQHANKTSTKVVLDWSLANSEVFSEEQKERLEFKLKNRLTKENVLQLSSDHTRSQHKNKEILIKRFFKVLEDALTIQKPRKKTKPSKASKLKRLKNKRIHSEKKANRKNPLS
ncbi:alternative ribosome rescue aminoacyl-tRNA hydrolase ArfB [Mesonia mobilis]|jgi:ribosome-associated protein|uniref:alternative ribosome rescue aminoacyl-tRNA hydrolase ArfB n=1 Tax=Mesonia mobilis TaxID=369791 RepID=UPI0026ED110F|nr:alternative ribosome rescue aminoacyl-tRNA hydrolase ArfB [Mesonia mobilis]|tara:strand:- start:115 stop:522 length:408 start_codon:yes stop_codon:yes gene_type:complete